MLGTIELHAHMENDGFDQGGKALEDESGTHIKCDNGVQQMWLNATYI